jgi:predicted membrane-bound spermidine synthase
LLYAANTAGAVVGCGLTGCALIFWLGVLETNIAAGLIDLGVGLTALAWDRRSAADAEESETIQDVAKGPALGNWAILFAAASGFCGLAYEVLWTRGLMATVTDDTTYAFTLMLTAFLAGHALGAWAAGRIGVQSVNQLWPTLGAAQMLAAAAALGALPLLVVVRDPISRASFVEGMNFWGARIPFHLALSLAVFGPSAFFLGASFTLAARLYVGRGRPVGTSTGRLYGLNTLAAILGAIVATAVLIPAIGTQRALMLLAVVQAGLGVLATLLCAESLMSWRKHTRSAMRWAALVGVGCGLNLVFPLTAVYSKQEPGKLLMLLEGSGAAITVHERVAGDRVISINGVNVAGTNPVLRTTQKLQAHLPVCLHQAPRSVLQIGFGSGGTCYSVSLHNEIESIDVVELNPDVLKVAAERFHDINHGVLNDSRVHVRIADAKSYVAATSATYDLILSDSTHPRFRGNAALYARDYFTNCARRLRPAGLLSTWLPLYGMSVDDIRGILKSVHSVFPHVQVWDANFDPHENTIIIASQHPIAIDPGSLAHRLAVVPVARDLTEVGINSVFQLLDFFMLGDRAVAAFSRSGRLNTDDHPRLEFLAPRTLRRKQPFIDNLNALRLAREPIDPYLVNATESERAQLARWYAGTTSKLAGQSLELEGHFHAALRAYTEGVDATPDDLLARIRLDRFRRAVAALPAPAGAEGSH